MMSQIEGFNLILREWWIFWGSSRKCCAFPVHTEIGISIHWETIKAQYEKM